MKIYLSLVRKNNINLREENRLRPSNPDCLMIYIGEICGEILKGSLSEVDGFFVAVITGENFLKVFNVKCEALSERVGLKTKRFARVEDFQQSAVIPKTQKTN